MQVHFQNVDTHAFNEEKMAMLLKSDFFKQLNLNFLRPKMRVLPQCDRDLSPATLRKMHMKKNETLKEKYLIGISTQSMLNHEF